ncbi:Mbeg1-like protein [Peptostreptococcus faecalis]|uniref:Mbeg1-like protein n=1 Tax=Peptostreptococcus faecalis TaxID=2045015 RepID=UPI000C7A02DB|nr:Mbeg1-like protein [Peptostreptococcus faecalis]
MNNIMDYIEWRGDLSFSNAEFNEVDSLILSELSYLNFGFLKNKSTLKEATILYFKNKKVKEKLPEYATTDFICKVEKLLIKAANSTRFKDLLMSDYIDKYDEVNQSQFSAITFTFKDIIYVAFRGTDDTLLGFKEDFNMSFSTPVQGQLEAVKYLKRILEKNEKGKIIVGGHSKGGNLAVYSVYGLDENLRNRVDCIYNYDGPGFVESIVSSDLYKETVKKSKKYIPKDSVVGILMNDDKDYFVVDAKGNTGFIQHDGFNWAVKGSKFVLMNNRTSTSSFVDSTLNGWLEGLDREERRAFINEVYDIITTSTEAKRINEITDNALKVSVNIVKNMAGKDSEKKEMMQRMIYRLIQSGSNVRKKDKRSKKIKRKIFSKIKVLNLKNKLEHK